MQIVQLRHEPADLLRTIRGAVRPPRGNDNPGAIPPGRQKLIVSCSPRIGCGLHPRRISRPECICIQHHQPPEPPGLREANTTAHRRVVGVSVCGRWIQTDEGAGFAAFIPRPRQVVSISSAFAERGCSLHAMILAQLQCQVQSNGVPGSFAALRRARDTGTATRVARFTAEPSQQTNAVPDS